MKKILSSMAIASVTLLAGCTGSVSDTVDPSTETDDVKVVENYDNDSEPAMDDTGADGGVMDQQDDKAMMTPRVIDIEAKDWEFSPATIKVKKGEKITLSVTGVDGDHGLAIPKMSINEKFGEGETVSIDLPTDTAGTFEFKCSVPCGAGHKEMIGTIVIE